MDETGQYLIKDIEKYFNHKRKLTTTDCMSYNYGSKICDIFVAIRLLCTFMFYLVKPFCLR